MPSDSENASTNLKARLKAKLKKAGVVSSDSSDDEDISKKKKIASTSSLPGAPAHEGQKKNGKTPSTKSVRKGIELLNSSNEEEEIITSKSRKPKPLESDESDSDESTVSRPRASSKKRANISSSSEDDDAGEAVGSESDCSDESGESASDESGDEDSEACSLIDNEAEEGDESDVSAEEEPLGETLSTEPSESSESDWESDWISETEEPCSKDADSSGRHISVPTGVTASCGFASDSSDGTSEKCPICLLRFTNQEVGTPESCDHIFCAECLQQWSKNVNTCPVDRQEFTLILVRRRVGGKVVRQIPVERAEANDAEAVEDPTYCEVCGNCDREDRMLLCDGCDLGYHMECLDPPLSHVPVDNWYCSECDHNTSTNSNGAIAEAVDFGIDEVRELLDDAQNLVGAPQPRRAPRMLPRTQQFERVLRRIRTTFLQRQEALQSQPSTSSGIESQSGEPMRKKRRVVKRKSPSKKKRKTTTKRKTKKTVKKKTSATSSKRTTKKKTTGKKRKARKSVGNKSKRVKVCSDSSNSVMSAFIVSDINDDADSDYSP